MLKGSVKDELGAVISNAHVVIHCDSSGHGVGLDTKACMKDDLIVTSDSQGEFSATFPPGFYDVFVSAVAFSPACRKVRLKQGRDATVDFTLKPDPLVTEELGTRYEFR
jgi:hypothetical protein